METIITSKLPRVGTTIFTLMSQLAQEYKAINLAQGFPNYPVDPLLIRHIQAAIESNNNQYAPMQGNELLRNEVARLIHKTQGAKILPENILITAGATQAIFTTIQALVHPGDEVILLDPCYDCYESPVVLAGAQPIHIPLDANFKPDWSIINHSVNPKTRMIIINSPHNPSGTVWDQSDLDNLVDLCNKHPKLLVLSDEVYEYMSMDKPHLSIRLIESLHDRSIVASSFGKTLHATGWKMGYLTGSSALLNEIKKVHQYLVFSVNSFLQVGIANYLPSLNTELIADLFRSKRQLLIEHLSKSRFELFPSEGTYFQLLNYRNISNISDIDFCHWLVKDVGVALVPLSPFYAKPPNQTWVRLCFAKDDATLIEASKRLCKI